MLTFAHASLLLVLCASNLLHQASATHDAQVVFASPLSSPHHVDPAILAALEAYPDPVDALLFLRPEVASELSVPRLLHIAGEDASQWLTEGDKLRLRRRGLKFIDITDHEVFYAQHDAHSLAGQARKSRHRLDIRPGRPGLCTHLLIIVIDLPNLTHQRLVKPLLPQVSVQRMHHVLEHMTSYYTRYFFSETGAQSAQWLHDHIAMVA